MTVVGKMIGTMYKSHTDVYDDWRVAFGINKKKECSEEKPAETRQPAGRSRGFKSTPFLNRVELSSPGDEGVS